MPHEDALAAQAAANARAEQAETQLEQERHRDQRTEGVKKITTM